MLNEIVLIGVLTLLLVAIYSWRYWKEQKREYNTKKAINKKIKQRVKDKQIKKYLIRQTIKKGR